MNQYGGEVLGSEWYLEEWEFQTQIFFYKKKHFFIAYKSSTTQDPPPPPAWGRGSKHVYYWQT
jgi:hypothetical protein